MAISQLPPQHRLLRATLLMIERPSEALGCFYDSAQTSISRCFRKPPSLV